MARRMAISRARTGARLASNPATLAHATNSTAAASSVEHHEQAGNRWRGRDPRLQLGAHGDVLIPVRVRVGALQIPGDDRQFRLRLRHRHAAFQASSDVEGSEIARFEAVDPGIGDEARPHHERRVELVADVLIHARERARA